MTARIFRPTFTVRRSLLILGAVVVGLAFPAASMGATPARRSAAPPCIPHPGARQSATCQIKTTAINKGSQGFKLTLAIHQGMPTGYGGRYPTSVDGILFRHTPKGTENDDYTFSGLKFSIGNSPKPLQSATIKGTFAHSGGSINMTFHATGPAQHAGVPKGCHGQAGQRRSGTLSGSYTLHADKLGTITQKSFKATISTASFQCNKPTHGYDVQSLVGNPYVDIFKSSTGKVTETIEDSLNGKGWQYIHKFYVAGLPGSDYTVQTPSNLKKATIKGGGGISGGATYSSSGSSSHKTTGKVSGTLAVTMASIGVVKAFPNPRKAEQTHT